MPIVPTYQPGQVQQSVARAPQASPESFGAGDARSLGKLAYAGEQLGQAAISAFMANQQRTERAQVRDVLSQAQNESMDFITSNVLAKRGKDAIGATDTTQKELAKIRDKYAKTLPNEYQKSMFTDAYTSVSDHGMNITRGHQFREQEAYQKQTIVASKAANVNNYLVDPLNKTLREQTEQGIFADNATLYAGFPEQARAASMLEVSKMHADAATTVSKRDAAEALAYLAENKAKINPETYATLTDKFKDQVITEGSARKVDMLSGIDEKSAMEQASKIEDPKERDLTIAGLKAHYASKNMAGARATADNSSALLGNVLQNPSLAGIIIPKDVSSDRRTGIINSANARMTSPVITDTRVYGSIINQARNDPDGFMRRDLIPYMNSLSNEDWNTVLGIRDGIAKKRKDSTEEAFRLDSIHSQFEDAVKGIPELTLRTKDGKPVGFDGKELEGDSLEQRKKQINDFRVEFQSRVNSQLPDKKDQTTENVQKILDAMTARAVVKKSWWKDETNIRGLVDITPKKVDPTVPEAIRGLPGIQRVVRTQGIDPTGRTNQKVYYYNYNEDRTAADVYDAEGKKVGTWPK